MLRTLEKPASPEESSTGKLLLILRILETSRRKAVGLPTLPGSSTGMSKMSRFENWRCIVIKPLGMDDDGEKMYCLNIRSFFQSSEDYISEFDVKPTPQR
jgi:hypothetical protein